MTQTLDTVPTPRLQFRWEASPDQVLSDGSEWSEWLCHYELVLPLGENDIRREVYEDGNQVGEQSELVVPIRKPTRRGCSLVPCYDRDGSMHADTPFRDGVHAKWDAPLLGNIPVVVFAPTGEAFLVEEESK